MGNNLRMKEVSTATFVFVINDSHVGTSWPTANKFSTLWLMASIAGASLRTAIARRMSSAAIGWRSWTIFNVSAQLPQCAASRNLEALLNPKPPMTNGSEVDALACASGASGFTPRRVLKQRQICSSCSMAKWVPDVERCSGNSTIKQKQPRALKVFHLWDSLAWLVMTF